MKSMRIAVFAALAISISGLISCMSSSGKTATFKVWGNCGMCKSTIEKSLKTDGIIKADWNKDTKQMTVKYDTLQIKLDDIHKYIAGVGYDTEQLKGDDQAYSNLHECCKYERKQ